MTIYWMCMLLLLIQPIYSWITCTSYNQEKLHTDNNTFTFLNQTSFDVCPRGGYDLTVSENSIGSLSAQSFLTSDSSSCWMYRLRHMHLTVNGIVSIEKGTFSCFNMLMTLNMSYNGLTTLQDGMFHGLDYLTILDLSYNSIKSIHNGVFGKGKFNYLTHVYLQNNDLVVMEPWAYVLNQILLFDLRNNSISTFSNTIGWEYDLEDRYFTEVDLRYNNLSEYRDEYLLQFHRGGDPSVDLLTYNMDLRDNPWNCDCHVHNIVSKFQNSFFLHVTNELTDVKCQAPRDLHNEGMLFVRRLTDLVCDIKKDCPLNCLCQKQPENKIVTVNCSGRGLTSMPQILPTLPRNYTYVLDFSFNSIKRLTKRNYTNGIQTLNMEGNGLEEIEITAISETQHLNFIDLNNNKLKSIPSAIQKLVFENTNLTHNQLVCDCDMTWMAEWVKRSPGITYGRNMKCTFQDTDEFIIRDLTRSLLNCSYDLLIGMAIGFGVLFVVVLILVIWAKRCPYETKVLLFRFSGFHPRDRYIVDEDSGTQYDVYVSFDDDDIHIRQWVLHKLAAKLEPTYKMFIPLRDLPLGDDRSEATMAALQQSKRVLIVLSDDYDKNEWSKFECQRSEILELNEGRIIFIKYHESVMDTLQDESWKTRLDNRKMFSPGGTKAERRWFWDKLKYELPVVSRKHRGYCFAA